MKALLALLLLSFAVQADTANTEARTVSQLGEGIYEIRHPDAPDGFPQGNTTVVIGGDSVLVVDSCLLPSSARQDIEQIRKWTRKPVTYLVNTHWHFDHTLGNATYAAAFPGLQIVAHAETRRMIASYNQGAVARYPDRQQRFQRMLDSGKDQDGRPLSDALRADLHKAIAGLAPVAAELKDAKQLVPNLAFDGDLVLDLGGREAQVRFLGRGNTAGDTVVYLPREKLLVAGDLLDHPVPYFFGGFPVDLIRTLGKIRALDVKTIVPGHGEVLAGTEYAGQIVEMVSAVVDEVERELDAGMTKDQILDAAPKKLDVAGYRQKFAGANKENGDEFDVSFAGLLKTAYNQLSLR